PSVPARRSSDLVETATGEFSIGAGYTTGQTSSSSGGFSLEGSITERNFLGRGQFIRFSAAGGEDSRDFTLSFTEPYFLGRRISAGFDIYRNTRKVNNSDNDHVYDRETTGGTIRFGLPITEALTAQVAYNYSQDEYERYGNVAVSSAIQEALDQGKWTRSSISTGLVYNTIDDQKNPRDGIYATAALEFAGLGGDAKYVKVTGRGNYYQTLSEDLDLVGLVTVGAGHVSAWGDDPLRIFDHFNSNDRIIRGFKYNGSGPYETNEAGRRDYLGGTTYFHGTVEAQFPIPVLPESIGLRGAVFADAATLYGNDYTGGTVEGTSMEWRASVGASLIWASPFGPLPVDSVEPVVKEDTDRIQHWNFGISTRFESRKKPSGRTARTGRIIGTMTEPKCFVPPRRLELGEIASLTGARLLDESKADVTIGRLAPAAEGGEDALVFVDGKKNAALVSSVR